MLTYKTPGNNAIAVEATLHSPAGSPRTGMSPRKTTLAEGWVIDFVSTPSMRDPVCAVVLLKHSGRLVSCALGDLKVLTVPVPGQ